MLERPWGLRPDGEGHDGLDARMLFLLAVLAGSILAVILVIVCKRRSNKANKNTPVEKKRPVRHSDKIPPMRVVTVTSPKKPSPTNREFHNVFNSSSSSSSSSTKPHQQNRISFHPQIITSTSDGTIQHQTNPSSSSNAIPSWKRMSGGFVNKSATSPTATGGPVIITHSGGSNNGSRSSSPMRGSPTRPNFLVTSPHGHKPSVRFIRGSAGVHSPTSSSPTHGTGTSGPVTTHVHHVGTGKSSRKQHQQQSAVSPAVSYVSSTGSGSSQGSSASWKIWKGMNGGGNNNGESGSDDYLKPKVGSFEKLTGLSPNVGKKWVKWSGTKARDRSPSNASDSDGSRGRSR
ncbi:hypothetical protein HDU76_004005 [Blyttiomyces sp. JEL0837]|nr:hypothetical protein HDU76_004005 [Blyttiomyces sp. JEL0837]